MRRREVIILLGNAAIGLPCAARAQQPAPPVIGFLNSASPELFAYEVRAFRQGLSEAGFVEGRNVAIEYRWAESRYDRLSSLATDLVRRRVDVIVTNGPAAHAAKAATTTIPIVFFAAGDPVALGLVDSLNRPGGNITGVATFGAALAPKHLELLHELAPTATVFALLNNPANPNADTIVKDLQAAARTLGLRLEALKASSEDEFDVAFKTSVRLQAGGLVIASDPFLASRIEQLAALAIRYALAAIYPTREFAANGGLMSYGDSTAGAYRLVGLYTGRILKGEKPADLPVQQATKVELILNLKTAKALGLTVPPTLRALANEVIE